MRASLLPVLFVLAVAPALAQRTHKPPLHGKDWMAVTGKPLGAAAGARIFIQGGNAVDAACAMLAATATMWDVLHWGGETQALIWDPRAKKVVGINALGVAPTGATPEFFRAKGFDYPPPYGPLAAVTPGTPGGLIVMLAEYGRLSLAQVLQPAIEMADGYPMEAETVRDIESERLEMQRVAGTALLFCFVLGSAGQSVLCAATAKAPVARLTILGDNAVARDGVKAVWGFACLIEARGHTVLFDTGADPAVLKDNLRLLNVNPAVIEAVVLSHYHLDHTWGVPGIGPLPGVRVFTPHGFEAHPKETALLESARLTLVAVEEMKPLFEGITISEPLLFKGKIPFGVPGQDIDEVWEQCLMVDTPMGLVVTVGCSHPGILAMLERVKGQTGRPLHLVDYE